MDFKQLEAFVAVVDYGSFSDAARRLYLTQPTISAHIRALEEELRTKLIVRTTKKISVTAKGYQLYDSAVRMLHIRSNLLEDFTESAKRIIDLGVSTIPSSYLLPELLAEFGKLYPDVYFHSLQSDSSGAIERVLDGSVDLSLVGQNTGEETCRFIPFCQDSLVIAAGEAYDGLKEFRAPIVRGKGEVIARGRRIALLAVGSMVKTGERVWKTLRDRGEEVTFVNMRFVKPFDTELLDELAQDHSLFVTMEENVQSGGFGEHVAAYMQKHHPGTTVESMRSSLSP